MGKYLSSVPGTFMQLQIVKSTPMLATMAGLGRVGETIYKLYWDFAEDWALFTGGTGVKEFAK